ncbi:PREDICTED: high mobility group protein 20A [Ceratosolen solmsi marchali]|uniref:High mobility group protein 20A n=1 Tax=Ceratosolen solmsi marchali TaxID=326594 RepID=A0AAJ6YT48_9HYME|nr:PREDICTED: high mobility group protein 20A [Ceratosolen solmsi marchali]
MNVNTITNINENKTGPSYSNLNGKIEDLSNHKSLTISNEKSEPHQENNILKKGSSSSNTHNSNRPKKRKKFPRDATAPKQPLTGYFRFLNDRREKVRSENPTMPFSEITKQLATEWNMLPIDQKQLYLDAAELDKERYNREFNDYKQTEAYRTFLEKQSTEKQNELKKERNGIDTANIITNTSTANTSQQDKNDDSVTIDIPIFTEEFLDHNKACETELRQLRKATVDYESQNAVLQRHVDSLHTAVNCLETETAHQQITNQALQRHLETLRCHLVSSFSNIPLADIHEGATLQNIDSYIERLEFLINSNMETSLHTAIHTAVSHLDFIK